MAERLTRNNKVNFYFHDEASNMVYYKLQKLEDIMEKYHCNDIEELEKKLADSDTWQKACELACQIIISGCCDCIEDTTDWDSAVEEWKEYNGIKTYGIGVEELLGYLLEKAKKEGSDE